MIDFIMMTVAVVVLLFATCVMIMICVTLFREAILAAKTLMRDHLNTPKKRFLYIGLFIVTLPLSMFWLIYYFGGRKFVAVSIQEVKEAANDLLNYDPNKKNTDQKEK